MNFTLRKQNMDAFQTAATRGFEQAAVSHLRQKLAAQVSGESGDALIAWVRDAMDRAAHFQLLTQQQIMCFLDAEALLGKRFYERAEHAWASGVLRSRQLQADDKAGLLLATSCSFFRDKTGVEG